jgi:hypothetical protein
LGLRPARLAGPQEKIAGVAVGITGTKMIVEKSHFAQVQHWVDLACAPDVCNDACNAPELHLLFVS